SLPYHPECHRAYVLAHARPPPTGLIRPRPVPQPPRPPRPLHSFPTRRSSDLACSRSPTPTRTYRSWPWTWEPTRPHWPPWAWARSEEHTSELQSRFDLVCRLPLETKNEAISR